MKKILCLAVALLMIFSLAACGRKSYAAATADAYSYPNAYEEGSGLASYKTEMVAEEAPAPEAAMSGGGNGSADSSAPSANPEKIIYTADVTVESTEFESSLDGLMKLIEEYGAYVESSTVNSATYNTISSGASYTRSAYYTVRVPVKSFDAMMSSLSTLGNIPSSNVYSDNITARYYDTQARLNNYIAKETRLVELLEQAESVSDVIAIENELTETRYMIESLQTTINSWDSQVSYSTIYVSLREVKAYTPAQQASFGKQLINAAEDGFDLLKDFVLWLVEALPVIIIIGLILFGLIKLFRRIFKGRKQKADTGEKASGKAAKKQLKDKEKAGTAKEKPAEENKYELKEL